MNSDLLDRFCQDCQMRNFRNINVYIIYIRNYIEMLESRSKDPIEANKEDLKDYLSILRGRGLIR